MSFKTWYHDDYLRESDLNNSPLDAEAPVPQQAFAAEEQVLLLLPRHRLLVETSSATSLVAI
jgi:hypothetical protein